jgi:hypothetical protein
MGAKLSILTVVSDPSVCEIDALPQGPRDMDISVKAKEILNALKCAPNSLALQISGSSF